MSVRNVPPPLFPAVPRIPDSLTWESRRLKLRPYPITSDELINVGFVAERGDLRFEVGFFPVRQHYSALTAAEIQTGKGQQAFPVVAVAEIRIGTNTDPLVHQSADGETHEEAAREAMAAADLSARILSLELTPEGPWRAQ